MSSALLGGVQSKIDWSAVYASWSRHIALCRGAGVRGEVDDRGEMSAYCRLVSWIGACTLLNEPAFTP